MPKRYDRAYFDRWYRHPRWRIAHRAGLDRRVRMVVAMAEHLLERPLRSVLDIGCGEGAWQPVLRRLRPKLRYQGLDPSPYVVERFGRRRNIRLGGFAQLRASEWRSPFDLVVCADVLHYLPPGQIDRGLPQLRELVGGIAYVSVFTTADDPIGDLAGWRARPPVWYRARLRRHGLIGVGMQCYVPIELEARAAALELCAGS